MPKTYRSSGAACDLLGGHTSARGCPRHAVAAHVTTDLINTDFHPPFCAHDSHKIMSAIVLSCGHPFRGLCPLALYPKVELGGSIA